MLKMPLLTAATIIANNHQMANLSKLNRFSVNNSENSGQIKKSFSGHERQKKSRDLYNDISSLFSSNNVTHSLGTDQTIEICGRIESLINLIRTEKKGLQRELISIIDLSKDRFGKLSFELENLGRECTKVKVLSAKIEELIDDYNSSEEIDKEHPTGNTGKSSRSSQHIKESILLPDEILNKDHDEELYGIYIEHLQEYISLLRLLTTKFWVAENKDNLIDCCYDIVGKLKSSANFMGYDKLSNYYLQWIAELEMADVDLSLAIPISFDFVDKRIKTVVGLFPEIKDIPSSDTAAKRICRKIKLSEEPHSQEVEDKIQSHEETKILQEIIGSLDEIDDEFECDEIVEPITSLSSAVQDQEETANPTATSKTNVVGLKARRNGVKRKVFSPSGKKEFTRRKLIRIDGLFLGQEKEKISSDEVLFQKFLQQLKENISILRELNSTFPDTQNKSQVIDQCSNLVGKLQSSASSMGYEWLEEYYLQWVAELELAGVELLMGSTVNIEFMQEKIDMIASLFLKKEKSLKPQPDHAEEKTHKNKVPPSDPAKVKKEIQVLKKSTEEDTEEDTEEAVLEDILILDESEIVEECIGFSYAEGVSNGILGAGMEEPYKVSTELNVSFEPVAGRSDKGFLEKIAQDSIPSLEERLFETETVELEEQSVRVDFSNVLNEKLDDLFMEAEKHDEVCVESSSEPLGEENNFTSGNSKAFFVAVFTCLSPLSLFQRFCRGFFKRSSHPSGLRREA